MRPQAEPGAVAVPPRAPSRTIGRLDESHDPSLPDRDRALIVLRDVTKTYPNGRMALREVDLAVPEGDFVFLVGPSGAGKSTLIRLLIGDELATRGHVYFDGRDMARLPRRQIPRLRRRIGVVFQDFKLLASKTVRENVAFALEVTGTPGRQIRPAVDFALSQPGVTGLCTAGDVSVLPLVLDACEKFKKMAEDDQEKLIASAGQFEPLFA